LGADLLDGFGPDLCAAVVEFVAIYAGDDDVAEVHDSDGVAYSFGFVEVEFGWAACGDVAEAAGAGADVAEDHEGGGAGGPAFAHVGAFGGLADGVKAMVVDHAEKLGIFFACGHFHF
jgi:hypothetical protein